MDKNFIPSEKQLSVAESRRLKELELVIREGFTTYVDVGTALQEIRGDRLYRNTAGRTWEGYCRELWDMSHQRADQLIAAKAVVENLTTIVVKKDGSPDWELLPVNESQARHLARLEPMDQRQVWMSLIEDRQKTANSRQPFFLTAKAVKAAVENLKSEGKSEKKTEIAKVAEDAKTSIRKQAKRRDEETEQFLSALGAVLDEVVRAQKHHWRNVPRQLVFDRLCALALAVGECDQETIKNKGVAWRGSNLDKLLATDFTVYRIAPDRLLIEQLTAPNQWLVYAEYETPEQGQAAFDDLMRTPTNLQW